MENALRYPNDDCALIYEVHASLLRALADDKNDDSGGGGSGQYGAWTNSEVTRENWIFILQTGITPVRVATSLAPPLGTHTDPGVCAFACTQAIHAQFPQLTHVFDRGYGPGPLNLKIKLLCALTDEAVCTPALRSVLAQCRAVQVRCSWSHGS